MARIVLEKREIPTKPKGDEGESSDEGHGAAHCPECGCAIKLVAAEDDE